MRTSIGGRPGLHFGVGVSAAAIALVAPLLLVPSLVRAEDAFSPAPAATATVSTPAPDAASAQPPALASDSATPAAPKAGEPVAPQPAVTAQAPSPDEMLASSIRAKLDGIARSIDREGATALAAFYTARTGAPLWVGVNGLTPKGEALVAFIRTADDWGLLASGFTLPAAGESPAEAEIMLSQAALKYARQAQGGRVDPTKLSRFIDLHPVMPEPSAVLAVLAVSEHPDAALRDYHPHNVQFDRLRLALAKARAPVAAPAPEREPILVPGKGPVLKQGMTHADVAILRQRLHVPAEAGLEAAFDAPLKAAVKAFQSDRDLDPTGGLNGRTRAALNSDAKPAPRASVHSDVERIVMNMERWRWMPRDLGAFYVWDNIPEFQTRVMRGTQLVHSEKIIVGKPDTPTPSFSATMQDVVFHPEWGVPDSIKIKELLPYLRQRDTSFFGGGEADTRILQVQNLHVSYNGHPVDAARVDWNSVDIRAYQFTQPPGGRNVLGVVKFRFPNKHDVYMHDTLSRELFTNSKRAFSHGCVRVQNPQQLAEVILAEDQGMSGGRVADLIEHGNNTEIALQHPIPVHITYLTAMVDDHGKLQTFGDLYGHDERLGLALSGKQIEFTDPPPVATSEALGDDAGQRPSRRFADGRSRRSRARSGGGEGDLGGFFAGLFGN